MTLNNPGARVEEERTQHQAIARLATARTAFVGRTLRGPVNRATLVRNFGEFQRIFGGLWQPSLLTYAVEQFFDNGGREASIVRVTNGTRPCTLSLRAGAGVLQLQALRPGTREYLRASVDYDNIAPHESEFFNLTLQRVHAHGTAQVEQQEIFQRLSIAVRADPNALTVALARSELVRVVGAVPAQRPDRTLDPATGLPTAFVASNGDGDDGSPLTDYDLIGSRSDSTGIFALTAADDFNFLCLPPLTRTQDVGLSALLVAVNFCKARRAMLVIDPPAQWLTADDALAGMRDWSFANENALMYFPRLLAHDKLRGRFETFAPCGAVAGMLARSDDLATASLAEPAEEPALRPGLRPACLVSEDRRLRLAQLGVNTLHASRTAARAPRPRTLAAANAGTADWRYLQSRRLALFIVNCVAHGTAWVLTAPPGQDIADAVAADVRAFLRSLAEAGAFGARNPDESYFVACGQDVAADLAVSRQLQFVFGFAALRERAFHGFRVTHAPAGTRVERVSVNSLNFAQFSPAELQWVDDLAAQLR